MKWWRKWREAKKEARFQQEAEAEYRSRPERKKPWHKCARCGVIRSKHHQGVADACLMFKERGVFL